MQQNNIRKSYEPRCGVRPTAALADWVRRALEVEGPEQLSARLRLSRQTLASLAARLSCHTGSIAMVELAMARDGIEAT